MVGQRQRCARCGLLLASGGPGKPDGALVIATGDGRWRLVERQTLHRPMCELDADPTRRLAWLASVKEA